MSAHTPLILLIVGLSITALGIGVFYAQEQRFAQGQRSQLDAVVLDARPEELVVVSIVGQDVSAGDVNTLRIQVRYDGEGELPLNETYIQVKTKDSIADLQYRNGTTYRSVPDGFYTR